MSECKSCNSGKYYLEEHDSTCYDCSSVNNVFTPTPAYNGGVAAVILIIQVLKILI